MNEYEINKKILCICHVNQAHSKKAEYKNMGIFQ